MSVPSLSALGRRARPPAITDLMRAALETPGLLSLAAGFTDNATLPVDALVDAWTGLDQIASSRADGPEHLQYGTNAGRPALRAALAARVLHQDGATNASPEQVAELASRTFITNGSQQALYLAVQTLCEPGDIVLVDRPSYFVFLELLAGLGVEARSMPVDDAGAVDLAALGQLLDKLKFAGERKRLKAVYFVSWFANPSGRTWSAAAKRGLAAVLRAADCVVPVIEDAAYRELGFDPASAASQPGVLGDPAWTGFPRLYTSTLTKPFATGLKVGYGMCDCPQWLNAMLHVKGHQDFGTSNFAQALLERAWLAGAYERQLATLRAAYSAKRDALDAALRDGLRPLGWRWQVPAGGLYLWLEGPASLDTGGSGPLWRAALDEGVLYVPGALCHGDAPPTNTVRLSYGVLAPAALVEAGARFVRAARRVVTGSGLTPFR